jgi:hypothetical protein
MEKSTYGNVFLQGKELRAIIKGELGCRKCPDCQGEGETWTLHYVLASDLDQDNEQQKDVGAQFAADFDKNNLPPEYSYGECFLYDCETCNAVGYLVEEFDG